MVTLKDGTEIKGEIKDLEWLINPYEIDFRTNRTTRTFSVGELISFSTDRPSRYESQTVQYDGDVIQERNLPTSRVPDLIVYDTVFVKVIVKSTISLFGLSDKNGRDHFFIQTDKSGRLEELHYRRYLFENTIAEYRAYQQSLMLVSSECSELKTNIKSLNYEEASLERIFSKINACKNYPLLKLWDGAVVAKEPAMGLIISAGLASTFYAGINFGMRQVHPSFGVFWESYSKRSPNRYSLYSEVSFSYVRQSTKLNYGPDARLSFGRLRLLNLARFSNPKTDGSRTYWGIGLQTGFRISTNLEAPFNFKQDESGAKFDLGPALQIGKVFPPSEKVGVTTELRYILDNSPFGETYFTQAHNVTLCIQVTIF